MAVALCEQPLDLAGDLGNGEISERPRGAGQLVRDLAASLRWFSDSEPRSAVVTQTASSAARPRLRSRARPAMSAARFRASELTRSEKICPVSTAVNSSFLSGWSG